VVYYKSCEGAGDYFDICHSVQYVVTGDAKWMYSGLLWNGLVTKGAMVSESSHPVDPCRFLKNSKWSIAENVITLGTTISESSHTVDHCRGCDGAGDYFDICCSVQ